MDLDEVLRVVAGRVPYLSASTAIDGRDWIGSDALLADPARLGAVIRAAGPGFGTDDDAVAASLFTEAYAFRLAGTALAAYALGLPVPDLAPDRIAIRIDQPRPSAVAYLGSDVRRLVAEGLAHALIDTHLRPFVASVHVQFVVGERNLWANVAAACAVAFRATESSGVERKRVRERAGKFFDACGPAFAGIGAFTTVEHDGRIGWYWDRMSCCLWFRTTDSSFCDNCSLLDPSELRARRIVELRG